MDGRDNPGNGDAEWRSRNRQEQRQRDERIAQQLQRQQETDAEERTQSQSFTFNLTPGGSNVVRGTGGSTTSSGGQSRGIRYVFNNDNNDDDDGWITIGSTVANFDNMSMGSGLAQNGGNNQFSVNLGNFSQPEGADPHPDDLPVEGEPSVQPPRVQPPLTVQQRVAAAAVQRQTMQSTVNLDDYFNQGPEPHPDDLQVEDPLGDPDEEPAEEPVAPEPQRVVTQQIISPAEVNVRSSGNSYSQQFHYRLGQNGEWQRMDENADNDEDRSEENDNNFQVLNSGNSGGVQIRSVQFTTRSSTSESTGNGGTTFVINTDGADGNNNFENWINLADHLSGLSRTEIESLPTRKLASRVKEYDCAVCMEPMIKGDIVRTLPCFHQLHVECVDPWLNRKKMCPVCRAEVKFSFEED